MWYRLTVVTFIVTTRLFSQEDLRPVRGTVVDSGGHPIPGVILKQKGARDVVSGDDGRFVLLVKKDARISMDMRRIGLFPGVFIARTPPDTQLTLVMYARPQVLPANVVLAQRRQLLERRGFYQRQRNEAIGGVFITPEDLDKRRPRSVTAAVEGVPGVKIDPGVPGTDSPMIQGRNNCVMTVYLDGIRLTPDSSATMGQRFKYKGMENVILYEGQKPIMNPMNVQIDQILNIRSVLAIEVYPRAIQAPPEYVPPRNDCGVVLLWTTGPER